MKMKKFLLAAAAIVASSIPAQAGPVSEIPQFIRGSWCFYQTDDGHGGRMNFDDKYERVKPCENGRLDVKGKSYESGWKDDDPSQTCNFRTVEEVVRNRIYKVRAECSDVELKWEEWTTIRYIPETRKESQFLELTYTRKTKAKLLSE
jgi:hypothetical protein